MYNKTVLIGCLGGSPESKTFPSGKKLTKFSLATNYGYGEKKETEWHNIKLWGEKGEMLHKGDRVLLEGRIRYTSWDNKEGGKSYKTIIDCHSWMFMNSKFSDTPAEGAVPEMPKAAEDDLPF